MGAKSRAAALARLQPQPGGPPLVPGVLQDRGDRAQRPPRPAPLRCGLRSGSAADVHGTPASFSARAIRATECPARRWAKIHRTRRAVCGSGSRRCARRRHAACVLFGCGPASASRYPYGGRPPGYRPCSRVWTAIAARTRISGQRRSPPSPALAPPGCRGWREPAASSHVGDGDRQLLGHPEFREPAVQSLTEVGDSLLRGLPLAVSAATGQRRVGTPTSRFSSCSTVYGRCTTRSTGVFYPRPSPGHGAVVKTGRPRACCAHARWSRAPPPGWPGRLKPRLSANRGMPADHPRRATLDR
jgi:hypothetical protein